LFLGKYLGSTKKIIIKDNLITYYGFIQKAFRNISEIKWSYSSILISKKSKKSICKHDSKLNSKSSIKQIKNKNIIELT